ncbi:ribonuclease HII [Candidatus Parcubacteria bacterium]|nr:ribonuclease HII [Candidatus Parcubacteria bacterium]
MKQTVHKPLDLQYFRRGVKLVAGLDEVGRGALAGPIVACAAVFDRRGIHQLQRFGVRDSKRLAPSRRETLCPQILAVAQAVAFGSCSARIIDRINPHRATLTALARAFRNLKTTAHHCLVDGPHQPNIPVPATCLIKGDDRFLAIAAASILAKVRRDRLMTRRHKRFPAYGFPTHKGYGTKVHRAALVRHGPSAIHRLTFV